MQRLMKYPIRIPSIEPTINDEPDSEGDALPGDFFDDELTIRSRSSMILINMRLNRKIP